MKYAPLALMTYNRPKHTRRVLDALMRCPELDHTPVFAFSDGPKRKQDIERVEKTRALLRTILGSRVALVSAHENQGILKSTTQAVTQLCDEFGQVIVVEDDLVVHPHFLTFMNRALERYQGEPAVMQVSGFIFPVPEFRARREGIFLPFMVPTGWGTWKRAWDEFDSQATGWEVLRENAELRRRFNFDEARDYSGMLERQMSEKSELQDAWDILWYWTIFGRNGLVYFPPQTLVMNIGLDGSGTHRMLSHRIGLGRQRLADEGVDFEYPEIREATPGELKAVWKASAKIGKKNPVYRMKRLLGLVDRGNGRHGK